MISNLSVLILVTLGAIVASDTPEEGPLLSTFRGVQQDVQKNTDGTYQFSFSLPQQERQEQRDSDGKVTGYYAFVDNSGEEFSLHFEADEDGFQPESDDLPQAPEETEDVQKAREEFLRYYEQTAKFLEELGSDEGSDSSSSSEEDGDYEEESDEGSSSEEDSSEEEDDEDSSEEEDDEEEDEEEDEAYNRFAVRSQRKFNNRGFGSRSRQQVLPRVQSVKQRENSLERSEFAPIPSFASFGRRT